MNNATEKELRAIVEQLQAKINRVVAIIGSVGCDCPCDCSWRYDSESKHVATCDERCLGCRIEAAIKEE